MPYLLAEIETTQPLPTVALGARDTGLAVVLRQQGQPVGFWMEALPAGRVLTPDELAVRIEREAGARLLARRIREEIAQPAPPAPLPALTIAVCTKDRPEWLRRCLDSLGGMALPEGGAPASIEVLVVDNAPSDTRTRAVVATFPSARYVVEPRPGLNFARNRALAEATGDLLVFLDDDVLVDAGWLAGLAEVHAEHPDAGGFTGLVLPYVLETEAQILFEQRGGFRRGFEQVRYGESRPGDPIYPCGAGTFGTGANMAFRREVLRELGGFDEALDTGPPLPGGGDLDMFYRVVRAGYPIIYEPCYAVFHEHRRDLNGLHRQYAHSWGVSLMAFVAKVYREEPAQRAKLRWLVRKWYRMQAGRIKARLRGQPSVATRTIVAEAWGGVVGLSGAYSRSVKRTEAIRRAHP